MAEAEDVAVGAVEGLRRASLCLARSFIMMMGGSCLDQRGIHYNALAYHAGKQFCCHSTKDGLRCSAGSSGSYRTQDAMCRTGVRNP